LGALLGGLFGLALAFASALLSTASREAGDVLATAVFALFRLAARRSGCRHYGSVPGTPRGRSHRPRCAELRGHPRGNRLSRAHSADRRCRAHTGNNLLFIVVAAMLGAVLVSGVVSAVRISGLEIELHLPHHVFAARAMPEQCCSTIAAGFRRSPSPWCLRWISVAFRVALATRGVRLSPGAHGRKAIVRWPDYAFVKTFPERLVPPVFEQRRLLSVSARRPSSEHGTGLLFSSARTLCAARYRRFHALSFFVSLQDAHIALDREVMVFLPLRPPTRCSKCCR